MVVLTQKTNLIHVGVYPQYATVTHTHSPHTHATHSISRLLSRWAKNC